MTKPSVLVVGSSNTDMIIRMDRIPKPGETILGGEFKSAPGGKGANQAVAAARAGGAVTFIARVGDDSFGERALEAFKADGINTDLLVIDCASPSGVAMIFVANTGQNTIAVAPGANSNLSSADVQRAKRAFRRRGVVLLQLETPLTTVLTAVELANQAGSHVILNPAPAQPLPARLLEGLFLLTPNEIEASLLTGVSVKNETSAARAAGELRARGVKNVIVTLGSRGAFVAGENCRQFVGSHKVKAVDATGAGDIFNGALAVAIAEGKPLLEAALFANAAAALSVMRLGAQDSAPSRIQIDSLLITGNDPQFSTPAESASIGKARNGSSRFPAKQFKKTLKIPA